MPISLDQQRVQRIRSAIEDFLQARLQGKLDKLAQDDPKRSELQAQFVRSAWIEDAASRAKQIQIATHLVKSINPNARGSNLCLNFEALPRHAEAGSHLLPVSYKPDVTGNAGAFDVYAFLSIEIDQESLLSLLLRKDGAATRALSDDANEAEAWSEKFTAIASVQGKTSSHPLAKQMYWCIGDDAADNSEYQLLGTLHSSPLAQWIFERIEADRFSDEAKTNRDAFFKKQASAGTHHQYPDLAIQKLGGTKPQTVSRQNLDRRGRNYLLGSSPPSWRSRTREPWGMHSVIDEVLLHRDGVKPSIKAFLNFLLTDPAANATTRNQVDAYVATLIDELVLMAAELQREWEQAYGPNWSADVRCKLVPAEQLWLNPQRAQSDEEFHKQWQFMDWPAHIGHRFGNWLNGQLSGKLPVGEAEHRQWKKELLLNEVDDGWADALHDARIEQKAPHYIPSRKGSTP